MPRARLHVNTGNLLEVAGAGLAAYAVATMWGVGWGLLVGAVLMVAGAELVYDAHVLTVPLPRRPHPVVRAVAGYGDARRALRAYRAVRGARRALRDEFGGRRSRLTALIRR